MAEIKVERTWHGEDIREMCIKHKYYDYGTNKDYNDMMDMVDHTEPTPSNIYIIASDILRNSVGDMTIESMMYDIEKECVNTFYSIEN